MKIWTKVGVVGVLALCSPLFMLKIKARSKGSLIVRVSVQASDTNPLHYQWRSTDGLIQNADSPTVTWALPQGPGLHFAYVLVSNGLGGYTERRIAVNTDTIGQKEDDNSPVNTASALYAPAAPPAPAQVGDYYRARLYAQSNNANNLVVLVPNASVFVQDLHSNDRFPTAGFVNTDYKGEFLVSGIKGFGDGGVNFLYQDDVDTTCVLFGQSADCGTSFMLTEATSQYLLLGTPSTAAIVGTLTLQDNSPCGTQNEFFGVHSTATATLLDAANNVLAGPVDANEFGDYTLPADPAGANVSLSCEGAPKITVPFSNGSVTPLPTAVVDGVNPPTVTNMTATLAGQLLASPNAIFLPPPANLPSDISQRADLFLAEKGLDTRLGACKYYESVGAVTGCGPHGELLGAINYDQWRRAVKIGQYARNGVPTFHASYINKVDLNLARIHESVTYGPNQTAAVVCNHLGAADFFNPTQAEIDTAVNSAVAGNNLVACVAMDYAVSPGVNGNKPYVRFMIFGPSGDLLPSINLDGRREKFVPGTCVVCHGGDHYAGKFPEDGSGFANVGGHFLPYDVGNFEFSTTAGLQRCDQENQIYHLNQNILNAGPTPAERELVAGWYTSPAPATCPSKTTHVLNQDYLPASWTSQDTISTDFYKGVVARSCRTCHVALVEGYNFDHYQNVVSPNGTDALPGGSYDFEVTACGEASQSGSDFLRWYTMPNSLVTFNRFWLSYQNSVGIPDQVTLLQQFADDTGNGGFCTPIPPK